LWPTPADGSGFHASRHPHRSLYDLRYPAAELALAESEGRRAQPRRVRAETDNPCLRGRCGDSRSVNLFYAAKQGSTRTLQRATFAELRKAVNAGAAPDHIAVDFGERADGRRPGW